MSVPTKSEADLREIYDRIYDIADRLWKRFNPCQIKDAETCTNHNGKTVYRPKYKGLCCVGCTHLGPLGCTVRSLSCKLWTCWVLGSINNPNLPGQAPRTLLRNLKRLNKIAHHYGLIAYIRASREETFEFMRLSVAGL